MTSKINYTTADNEKYELRTWKEGDTFFCQAFKDNKPANPFRYQINSSQNFDFLVTHGYSGFEAIMDQTKRDLEDGLVFGKKLTNSNQSV